MPAEKQEVEVANIADLYVAPNNRVSRQCTKEDIPQILKDAQLMYDLCSAPVGIYKSAFAIAHCQINNTDPLAFYVTKHRQIIINPKIIRHTNHLSPKPEGCMTFHRMEMKLTSRFYRCDMEYYTVDEDDRFIGPLVWSAKGIDAQVIQHEIDHINGKNIYDIYN